MLSRFNKTRKLKDYLEREKHSYHQIFENSLDINVFVVDTKGVIVKVEWRDDPITIKEVDIVGKKYNEFIYKEDVEKVSGYFAKALNGVAQSVKYRVNDLNGAINEVQVTIVPIQLENSEVIGVYGLTHTSSSRQELQHLVEKTQERFQSLIQYSHEMIGILALDGTIFFENHSNETILGYQGEELTGKNCIDLIHPDDHPFLKAQLEEIVNQPNKPFTLEMRLKHKNGEWRDFEVIFTNHLHNSSIEGIVCNYRDMTEIKKQKLEIQYMAYHDYLTELPNRRAFEDRVDLEIRLANIDKRQFAVLFLDLDGFKYLNDSLGHDMGDLLLIEVAKKLKSTFKNDSELVARLSGNEFALLTTNNKDHAAIELLAKEILQIFETPFLIKNYSLFIKASIGISIYPESGDNTGTLMKNADLALYLAKKEKTNQYKIFSPTANVATYKAFSLRSDMQKALHDNQFVIHYQPIVHTETKQIVMAEALLRWNHPDWGIVSPKEFIPLAEESGLIVPISDWILREVCSKVRLWHNDGYYIKASVNLSIIQFFQTNFIESIKHILQENELEPEWLVLEITESTLLEREEEVLEKMTKLREMGIKISLDDFGTGYSSLAHLKK